MVLEQKRGTLNVNYSDRLLRLLKEVPCSFWNFLFRNGELSVCSGPSTCKSRAEYSIENHQLCKSG
ncbi:unnamed protein product [Haemonchus placei]|uniref:Ovule protein n=1 Tax=Haemonchus placei TaxID=6290 RepID=A0A0N4X8Y5_HAEPC|nr:unnamed protein product [Haemonchus placei]